MIFIVGLGVEKGDLTDRAKAAILDADKVVVRTSFTPSYQNLADIGINHTILDFSYVKPRNFQSLNKQLAAAVRKAERDYGNVAYCVDGSATDDASAKLLLQRKRGKVRVISGVSKGSKFADIAGFSCCSYTACSAFDLADIKNSYGLSAPLVVYDMDDYLFAGEVKMLLSDAFGDETDVWFIQNGKKRKIKLYEIDRMDTYDAQTAVCIDIQPMKEKTRHSLQDLESIIKRLRRPDGCPWDRVQTPESIKMSAVEEAYELLDAIDSGDSDKILEEVGDVLMQVVFHAVMQEEKGEFNLTDVLGGVCDKLITRHTHVFGEDFATDETSALSVWEKNKMKEKSQNRYADAVNDVPKCFPALLQAQKIVKRLEKGGLRFSFDEAKSKLLAALDKLEGTKSGGDAKSALGEYLLWTAWLCQKSGADGEEALLERLKAVKKTYETFESLALADGKDVTDLTAEEKEKYARRAEEKA